MKKLMALLLTLGCLLALCGCKPSNPVNTTPEPQKDDQSAQTQSVETIAPEATEAMETAVIMPLPVSFDIANPEDSIVAVSLEKGKFYTDKNGTVMMDVTVYVYDQYDMAAIAGMKEGDTLTLCKEEILISSLKREDGKVLINGGLDNGGIELRTDDDTLYYACGYSDVKSYYELGKVSLPVSADFVFSDTSDLDKGEQTFRAEDFLNEAEGIDYHFDANNTTIRIEGGQVVAMERVYTP